MTRNIFYKLKIKKHDSKCHPTFIILKSSWLGLAPPCEIEVKIQKVENRKNGSIKDKNGQTFKAPVFMVSQEPNESTILVGW